MKKRFLTILAFVILAVCFLPVSAFGGNGVVRLNYVKSGVSFKIYKIGSIDSSGSLVVEDNFSGYGIDFESTEAAQTLAGYIERNNIPEEGQAATGSDGTAVFSGLDSGYYLILGETCNDGDYIYTALPVMLAVYESQEYEISGKYEITDISSDDNYQSISALKVWSGESLDSITVQLLCDGEIYDEQTLNSSGNWRYTWSGLDLVHSWTVTEKDVPSGYSLSIEKDGQVYIIHNTKDSDTPSGGETTTEATTETKTEATTEAKTETTTKKPSGGGGGGGGSVVVNTTEATTEADVEATTENGFESGTESEEVTEEDVEDTTEKKNDISDEEDEDNDDSGNESDDESNDGGDSGSDSSSGTETDEYGNPISESQMGDNSGIGSNSSASSSSASISSESGDASAASVSSSSESGASVSSQDSARLPQTGQLWFPVPILSCCGVFLLILGIGRRRMS